MAGAGPILGVTGAAIEVAGALREGQSEGAAADYNADIAEQNARDAEDQGAAEERRSRIASARQIGQARADYGASGVTLEGSPLDILAQSAKNAEYDALIARHNGEVKSASFRNEARLNRMKAENARIAGYLKASSYLLKAGGSMPGKGSTQNSNGSDGGGTDVASGASSGAESTGGSFA